MAQIYTKLRRYYHSESYHHKKISNHTAPLKLNLLKKKKDWTKNHYIVPVMRTRVSLPDKSVTCWNINVTAISKLSTTNFKYRGKWYCTYNEGVIKRGKNVGNTKNNLPIPYTGTESNSLLLRFPDFPIPWLQPNLSVLLKLQYNIILNSHKLHTRSIKHKQRNMNH